MKKKLMAASLVIILILTFCLGGCDSISSESAQSGSKKESFSPILKTVSGYISTELATPEWVGSFGKSEAVGDVFYIVSYTTDNRLAIAAYDTLHNSWQRIDLNTGDSIYPGVALFSASEEFLWVVLRENYTIEEISAKDYSRSLSYYLIHVDLNSHLQTCNKITWWSDNNPYLLSLIALDRDEAILSNGETTYLIDSEGQIIETPDLKIMGDGLHVHINGEIYINSFDGLTRLDQESLQYAESIGEIMDQSIYSSSLGNVLTTKDSVLYCYNPLSGEKAKLFSWMDVSLSYSNLYGWSGLENSNGEIVHLTNNKLIKVTKGEVPEKRTLVLACLGDASEQDYMIANNSYVCSDKLMDAILRFNNSDPEYRIEVRPFIYNNEAERNRMLLEISTGNEVDLIDTSLLPDGAIDKHLLVDLMPLIDADEYISREDFIPSLLNSMMKNGSLYEYVDKYTLLTMYTRPEFVSDNHWTVQEIAHLIREHPDLKTPYDQDRLILLFSWAATAEFVDKNAGTCRFDNPVFIDWLSLLKMLSNREDRFDSRSSLFSISYDYSKDVGYLARNSVKDNYVVVGFPESIENGSYFMKLGRPGIIGSRGHLSDELDMYTLGAATSLGIMASSSNRDGAWRFLRTFICGEEMPSLHKGIPVLKEGFELAIQNELNKDKSQENLEYESFNQNDAVTLRELVYNTNLVVCSDEDVMIILTPALTEYVNSEKTADQTAALIQSKMSIYLSEHYG